MNRERGFTLVELLVVIGLIALVTAVTVNLFYQFYRVPRWGQAQLNVSNALRSVALWLAHDAHESSRFTPAGSCGVFDTGRGVTYTYTLNGHQLERTESGSGRTRIVARYVTTLQCPTSVTSGLAVFRLTLSSGPVSISETLTVTLRVAP